MVYCCYLYCAVACEAGWHPSITGHTCYKFSRKGFSYLGAQAECKAVGGTLAIVDTLYKANNLVKVRRKAGKLSKLLEVSCQLISLLLQ